MKIAIVYSSIHHGNTKKVVEAIRDELGVELIKAQEASSKDLSQYDVIGLASGIYMAKCHEQILKFIEESNVLSNNKKVFIMITSGSSSKKYGQKEQVMLEDKKCKFLGTYRCKGYDTYSIFKWIGGIAKGHPNTQDIKEAIEFVKQLK